MERRSLQAQSRPLHPHDPCVTSLPLQDKALEEYIIIDAFVRKIEKLRWNFIFYLALFQRSENSGLASAPNRLFYLISTWLEYVSFLSQQ